MNLKEVMEMQTFAILGDTLNEEKYAYRIKHAMINAGYKVFCVGKELASLNDIDENVDVIDLCIHPVKGLFLLKELRKKINFVVIQPGAESADILAFLNENKIPYLEGCLLVGLAITRKN